MGKFSKVFLCIALLLTGAFSQSQSIGDIKVNIEKLEKIFLETDENDHQKLAETARKLSYYYEKRQWRNGVIIAATWLIRGGAVVSNSIVAVRCKKRANFYNDLYKFYSIEQYYSLEENANLQNAPIRYGAGKSRGLFSD